MSVDSQQLTISHIHQISGRGASTAQQASPRSIEAAPRRPLKKPGNLNRNMAVDVSDIHLMVDAVYGSFIPIGGYAQIDFNNDCRADILDVLAMIHHVFYRTGPLLTGCEL